MKRIKEKVRKTMISRTAAQVYANWPVHLPAWGALRALETAAPHAESSAQMAVRVAVAAAQAAVRAAAHIHAVQDALHQ